MNELLQLLQDLDRENKCDKCGGTGKVFSHGHYCRKIVHKKVDDYIRTCLDCTGGFIVPGLNETKWVMDRGTEVKRADVVYQLKSGLPFLPSPTLTEVLDMLPKEIKKNWKGKEVTYSLMQFWSAGQFHASYYDWERRCFMEYLCADPNPLIAALKLLLWYIKQRKEGKV